MAGNQKTYMFGINNLMNKKCEVTKKPSVHTSLTSLEISVSICQRLFECTVHVQNKGNVTDSHLFSGNTHSLDSCCMQESCLVPLKRYSTDETTFNQRTETLTHNAFPTQESRLKTDVSYLKLVDLLGRSSSLAGLVSLKCASWPKSRKNGKKSRHLFVGFTS